MKDNNNMNTTPEQIISGTEAELLEKLKQKYNLVENMSTTTVEVSSVLPVTTQLPVVDAPIRPAVVGNKVSTGFSGLFDGTSWGN
jgi:hypothetical protein